MTAVRRKSDVVMRTAGMEGQKAATGITGIMNSTRTVNITWITTRTTKITNKRTRLAEEPATMAGADRGAKEDIAELPTLATTFRLYIQQSLDFTCLLW